MRRGLERAEHLHLSRAVVGDTFRRAVNLLIVANADRRIELERGIHAQRHVRRHDFPARRVIVLHARLEVAALVDVEIALADELRIAEDEADVHLIDFHVERVSVEVDRHRIVVHADKSPWSVCRHRNQRVRRQRHVGEKPGVHADSTGALQRAARKRQTVSVPAALAIEFKCRALAYLQFRIRRAKRVARSDDAGLELSGSDLRAAIVRLRARRDELAFARLDQLDVAADCRRGIAHACRRDSDFQRRRRRTRVLYRGLVVGNAIKIVNVQRIALEVDLHAVRKHICAPVAKVKFGVERHIRHGLSRHFALYAETFRVKTHPVCGILRIGAAVLGTPARHHGDACLVQHQRAGRGVVRQLVS